MADDGAGDVSNHEASDDAEAGEVCDLDFGQIPAEKMGFFANSRDKTCRRCGCAVAAHAFSAAPAPVIHQFAQAPAGAGAGGAAGGAAAGVEQAGSYVKQLQKTTDALTAQATFRIVLTPQTGGATRLDLNRLFRGAESSHQGPVMLCPDIVSADLPERPTRKVLLSPWVRCGNYAMVADIIRGAIEAELHSSPEGYPIRLSNIFVDGAPGVAMRRDDAFEMGRALSALAIGLRCLAVRDEAKWARSYQGAPATLLSSVLGKVGWFVAVRNRALDRLKTWIVSLRTCAPTLPEAPGAAPAAAPAAGGGADGDADGGGGAAAGGARGAGVGVDPLVYVPVDLRRIAAAFPWVALGLAVVHRGGKDDPSATDAFWTALDASEAVTAAAVKQLTGDSAIATGKGGGDGPDAAPRGRGKTGRDDADADDDGPGAPGGGNPRRKKGPKTDPKRPPGGDGKPTKQHKDFRKLFQRFDVAKVSVHDCGRAHVCRRCKEPLESGRHGDGKCDVVGADL